MCTQVQLSVCNHLLSTVPNPQSPHPSLPPCLLSHPRPVTPQTFHGDFELRDRDFRLAAAQDLGELRGKPVSDEALKRLLMREEVRDHTHFACAASCASACPPLRLRLV